MNKELFTLFINNECTSEEIDYGGDDVGNTAYYWKKKINPLAP